MYYSTLLAEDDGETTLTDSELYNLSSPDLSMSNEIRLARTRLARAVASGDERAMQSWLDLLHAIVRIQAGLDGARDDGELRQMLEKVADQVRLEQEQEAWREGTLQTEESGSDRES